MASELSFLIAILTVSSLSISYGIYCYKKEGMFDPLAYGFLKSLKPPWKSKEELGLTYWIYLSLHIVGGILLLVMLVGMIITGEIEL